jgi:hypothetical protein
LIWAKVTISLEKEHEIMKAGKAEMSILPSWRKRIPLFAFPTLFYFPA